jgi:tRNA(Ile)-lysidine synthase
MDLQRRVQDRMRAWLPPQSSVLVAVSGGPDSVALAYSLRGLPYRFVIGHVDHGLRKSSRADAAFVRRLANRLGWPFRESRINVMAHRKRTRQGIEEAARELRYDALARMASLSHCAAVVTGHSADDQAETILMNFLRGAGPTGMSGIPPVRPLSRRLRLLRPMLAVTRTEVVSYVKKNRLTSRLDPTNRSDRFTRNRIRRHLLPELEKQYPGLKARLSQMADVFREDQALWAVKIQREINKTVRQNNKMIAVDLPRLLSYHKALGRRILRHFLTGISFQDLERVYQLALSPSRAPTVQLSGGFHVKRRGQALVITRGMHE